jgi:hypothetical protein
MPSLSPPIVTPGYNNILAVGDFNHDGNSDLVTVPAFNTVSILLGKPNGTFVTAQTFTGVIPNQVCVADVTCDGKLDLVMLDSGSVDVHLMPGNGDGTFAAAQTLSLPRIGLSAQNAIHVAAADMNNDGKTDLVVVGSRPTSSTYPKGTYVNVLLSKGDGTFAVSTTTVDASAFPYLDNTGLQVSDFNGDGKMDVWVNDMVLTGKIGPYGRPLIKMYHTEVLPGQGNGLFGTPVLQPNIRVSQVGDLNGDGKSDLLVFNPSGPPSSTAETDYVGQSNGTFRIGAPLGVDGYVSAVGDFNHDGKLDLVTLSSTLSILLGNGDGTFLTAVSEPADPYWGLPFVGDFNGDGWLDVAVDRVGASPNVTVFLNDKTW